MELNLEDNQSQLEDKPTMISGQESTDTKERRKERGMSACRGMREAKAGTGT